MLWLATEGDFAIFALPNTVFRVCSMLAGPNAGAKDIPDILRMFKRLPFVLVFIWQNLFVFDLANHILPSAIMEDRLKKPWLPVPAGYISCSQGRKLLIIAIISAICINRQLDAAHKTAGLMSLI